MSGITKSTLNQFDYWSLVHYSGCIALVLLFYDCGINLILAANLSWWLGLFWEILDEIYYFSRSELSSEKQNLLDRILDPRGGSWLDFLCDVAGAFSGFGIIKLIEWSIR